MNFLLKSISPQSANVYRLLEGRMPMSAKEIGKHLKIFPNAVYRAVKQLLELGTVEEVNEYPVKFIAKPISEGLDIFSSVMRQNFQDTFGEGKSTPHYHQLLRLVFVQKRNETIRMTEKDTKRAKDSINLIVSGLELPADTLLANQRAVERGVKVRLLVQNLKEVTAEKLNNWKRAGVGVKYYPNMEARIYIYDHRIVYFTSYDPKNTQEAIGMRFEYPPYAKMMDDLFEQRWQKGKMIN